MVSITFEEIHDGKTMLEYAMENGLTPLQIIQDLKRHRKDRKTVQIKVKGAVSQDNLAKGFRIVATSGVIFHSKSGDSYGDGETIIERTVPDNSIQLQTTDIIIKMFGLNAPTKSEFTGKDGSPLFSLYDEVKGKSGSLVSDLDNKRG